MKAFATSLIALCFGLPLMAEPITYTMTGTLSGTLGGVAVTDATFKFVFNGDTANIFDASPTLLLNPATSTSLFITGFGSGDFTQTIDVGVDLQDDNAGFANPGLTDIFVIQNAAFGAWNDATSIGPLEQFGAASQVQGSFSTSLGTLALIGADNVSFGAAVPEPSLIAFVGCSMLGTIVRRSWIRRTRAS